MMYELFGFELADFRELFYVFCSACLSTATALSDTNTRSSVDVRKKSVRQKQLNPIKHLKKTMQHLSFLM